MKKMLRFVGIAALAAVIGFGFASCEAGTGSPGARGDLGPQGPAINPSFTLSLVPYLTLDTVSLLPPNRVYDLDFGVIPSNAAASVVEGRTRAITITNSGNVALGFRVPLVGSHFAVTTAEADDTDNGNLVFNLEAGISRTIVIAPVPTLMDLTSNRGLYAGTISITGGTLGISLVSDVNAEIVIGVDARALDAAIEVAEYYYANTVASADGEGIETGYYWATSTQLGDFRAAINAAIAAYGDHALTQAQIDTALENLDTAIDVFTGYRTEGAFALTPQDLVDAAIDAIEEHDDDEDWTAVVQAFVDNYADTVAAALANVQTQVNALVTAPVTATVAWVDAPTYTGTAIAAAPRGFTVTVTYSGVTETTTITVSVAFLADPSL